MERRRLTQVQYHQFTFNDEEIKVLVAALELAADTRERWAGTHAMDPAQAAELQGWRALSRVFKENLHAD